MLPVHRLRSLLEMQTLKRARTLLCICIRILEDFQLDGDSSRCRMKILSRSLEPYLSLCTSGPVYSSHLTGGHAFPRRSGVPCGTPREPWLAYSFVRPQTSQSTWCVFAGSCGIAVLTQGGERLCDDHGQRLSFLASRRVAGSQSTRWPCQPWEELRIQIKTLRQARRY